MTAWQIQVYYVNNTSGSQTLMYDSGKKTTGCPFDGRDSNGDVQLFSFTLSAANSPIYNTPNFTWKWYITQWWGGATDSEKIVQSSPSVFNTQATPTVTISNTGGIINYGRTTSWTGTYTGGPLMWARWQLYRTVNGEYILIDDTGEVATSVLSYTYDGISYWGGYYIVCTVQNTYGMQASTEIGFGVSATTKQWFGSVQACKREDLGGTLVKWNRILDTPVTTATLGTRVGNDGILDVYSSDDNLQWNKVNGATMRIVYPWTAVWMGYATALPTEIVRLTVGQLDGGGNLNYTIQVNSNGAAVFLGGVKIGQANVSISQGDRVAIIATPTRIWVSVWNATLNTATGNPILTLTDGIEGGKIVSLLLGEDDSLTALYQTAVSDTAASATSRLSQSVYNIISQVGLYGPQQCEYFWIIRGSLTDSDAAKIIGGTGDYKPSWNLDYDTWFLTNFWGDPPEDVDKPDYRYIAGNVVFGTPFAFGGADLYRRYEDEYAYQYIGSTSGVWSDIILDASAKSNKTAEYTLWLNDASDNPSFNHWYGATSVTPCFSEWHLISATENSDGSFTPNTVYRFRFNVTSGAMTNSNAPNVLQNFTQYPTVQLATANYKAGTLTGYIGSIDSNYQYTEQIGVRDALFALSVSDQPLFLRSRKGDFLRAVISAPVTATVADNTRQQMESMSVSWVEVADTSRARVYLVPPGDILAVNASASAGYIGINWNYSANTKTYTLERQALGQGDWTTLKTGIPLEQRSYQDATVVSGTQYRYRVCGVNATGNGDYTESALVTAQ